MSISSFTEALRPLARRTPRVVREHEILRIAAVIQGQDKAKVAAVARGEVLAWAEKKSGGLLPAEAWEHKDFERFSGGRNNIGVRIETDESDIWAIQSDDPDKSIPGRVWTTEVAVWSADTQQPRFSLRLLVNTAEEDLDIDPHSPGLVHRVIDLCGLSVSSYNIRVDPWYVSNSGEAGDVVEMILDPVRRLPVFILSVPEAQRDPLLDGHKLAAAIVGIGHVIVMPSELTWALTERFGRLRSVYNGAVRAYLPGFSEDSDPYDHRLVLADHILTMNGAAQCMRWMQSLAGTESRKEPLGKNIIPFATIRNASLQVRQQRLAREGASDRDQLDAANTRIGVLEKQLDDELGTLMDEFAQAEDRAKTAEEQLRASAFRIQHLLEQLRTKGDSDSSALSLPASWPAFASWCDSELAGRVILSPRARQSLRKPDFSDAEQAARCLLWLATEGRDRRLNGGEGSLREEYVEDGIRNAHCGNDQFDVTWQGQPHTADWHIKNGGNTRDPARCLRIYYFWDPNTLQIVIADMPAHRRTDAT
jgi:hypothetical protein